MERLQELLFELSSSERMNIVLELQRRNSNMSQVSRNLNLTVAEASRHLKRLSEAFLVQKDVNGLYGLTPFGTLLLSQLSGLDFAAKHQEYFLEYDISSLPYEFIDRIGELGNCLHMAETLKNLAEGENRIRKAREFVWILSDQVLTSSIPPLAEKVKASFDLRIVLPESTFPPEIESRLPASQGVQKRVLPKVDVVVVVTENYAVFCLPNRGGRIDYRGFGGEDPKFHKWCKDLFLHYWEKAKPFVSE